MMNKVVVIVGCTGAGKSRLAIDLAQCFPAEIINADKIQVYEGLDILGNKVTTEEKKGIPHHLLGIASQESNVTCKKFREMATIIIESIFARKKLPIIVGGTNHYIQALVSSFIGDNIKDNGGVGEGYKLCKDDDETMNCVYDELKEVDPNLANCLHPGNSKKIKQYLEIYNSTKTPPSHIFQQEKTKEWGRDTSFRYDCCFIWVDASTPVLEKYVEKRVDSMVKNGLWDEVSKFYQGNIHPTCFLWKAIGVREFCELFSTYPPNGFENELERPNLSDSNFKGMFDSAILRMKKNTIDLVHEKKQRLHDLSIYFGWNLHRVDSTRALETIGRESEEYWHKTVVEKAVDIVRLFLSETPGIGNQKENNNIRYFPEEMEIGLTSNVRYRDY